MAVITIYTKIIMCITTGYFLTKGKGFLDFFSLASKFCIYQLGSPIYQKYTRKFHFANTGNRDTWCIYLFSPYRRTASHRETNARYTVGRSVERESAPISLAGSLEQRDTGEGFSAQCNLVFTNSCYCTGPTKSPALYSANHIQDYTHPLTIVSVVARLTVCQTASILHSLISLENV